MAAQITRERTGEYHKMALLVLKEKGGKLSSAELVQELQQRLNLTDYERSLNKSGSPRWRTHFRFTSVGLVKAGWIEKKSRIWSITDKAQNFEHLSPLELMDFLTDGYNAWKNTALGNDEVDEVDVPDEEEPEILMEVRPADINFQNLLSGIEQSRIQIPPFQRSFVWEPNDIRSLLDSIYRGYPIGSFIFWKTTRKLPSSRTIGNIVISNSELMDGTEIAYVLDGQQRITSLFAAVRNAAIDGEYYRFLFNLRSKTFSVERNSEPINKDAVLTQDIAAHKISIDRLFVETQAEYRRVTQLYSDEDQDVLANLQGRFASYRFSVVEVLDVPTQIDEEKEEGVKQVVRMFSRINEKGKKLTVVAKMVARCWGEGFDLRERLNDFYERSPELETIREETILQAASAILNYRQSRSRIILDKTDIQELAASWDAIEKAFLAAIDFVKATYRVKNLQYLPFDAVLVPLTYLFYKKRQLSSEQLAQIGNWFWGACLSNRYGSTLEAKTEEDCVNFDLLLEGKEPTFNFLIDWDSLKEKIISQPYNLRNAFVKTLLCLYSYAEPKNIVDGSDVILDGVFSGYYKHQLHHIFPVEYMNREQHDNAQYINSVANIMLIPALTNNHISDKAPGDYFPLLAAGFESAARQVSLVDILNKHHYISGLKESGIETNDYELFLNKRAERLVSILRTLTGVSGRAEGMVDTEPVQAVDSIEIRIRSIIDEKLSSSIEGSYWDTSVPADIRTAVDMKMADHLRRHPYYSIEEYEQDSVRLRFMDIMDYCKIILVNWELFGKYFGSKTETERYFVAYKNYRNVLKHPRGVDEVEKKNGEAALIWIERVLNTVY